MTEQIPEPEIRMSRNWTVTYRRPRRGGWPNITTRRPATGETHGIGPLAIRVSCYAMHDDTLPKLQRIEVKGRWLRSKGETGWRDLGPGRATISSWAVAPDWVMHLAADAQVRCLRQLEKEKEKEQTDA